MEETTEIVDQSLHSEPIQDIIGSPPVWLYRWGISVVLLITILCILSSSFIQYPEVVRTKLKLVFANPQRKIACKDSSRLLNLQVQSEQIVKVGQILALVETAKGKTFITAPCNGKVRYAGIIRENELLKPGQTLFEINFPNEKFYGELLIPPYGSSKVKPGQTVLVKTINEFNNEQTVLHGKIRYIASDTLKHDNNIGEVDFKNDDNNTKVIMNRNGVMSDAEIIVVPSTLFKRIVKSLTRSIK